jgi:hypothetical protein
LFEKRLEMSLFEKRLEMLSVEFRGGKLKIWLKDYRKMTRNAFGKVLSIRGSRFQLGQIIGFVYPSFLPAAQGHEHCMRCLDKVFSESACQS